MSFIVAGLVWRCRLTLGGPRLVSVLKYDI